MKYQVGNKVKVRNDLTCYREYGCRIATKEMCAMKGKTVTIKEALDYHYLIEEDKGYWMWTDEMFEPVDRELTAEEAIKIQAKICNSVKSCQDCAFNQLRKGKFYSSCAEFRLKNSDKLIEVIKQQLEGEKKKEIKVCDKMYCRIVDSDGSTVYTEAVPDECSLSDTATEVLKKYCSKHDGDYFAVCENRFEVVK